MVRVADESSLHATKRVEKSILLHGDLKLRIIEAKAVAEFSKLNRLLERCKPSASSSEDHVHIRAINAWVTVSVAETIVARTRDIDGTENLRWDEKFKIPLGHPVVDLEFKLLSRKKIKIKRSEKIKGSVKIPAEKINTGKLIDGWFPLIDKHGNPYKYSILNIEMEFTPWDQNPLYRQGIASDPEQAGVGNTYFPPRKGNAVMLYQDAHVPENMLPEIKLEHGRVFEHHKCWEEIYHAIWEAKKMIYIVGWSVFCQTELVREPTRPLPGGENLTLGELLKSKAKQGIQVVLLIWDDQTSWGKFGIKSKGVMKTHDEETRKFFKGTTVICDVVHRGASSLLGPAKRALNRIIFSNPQKYVLVDTQAAGNDRKITAFLGGLDLCDGRYDTPEHRLFGDLDTIFEDDFYNPTFRSEIEPPRQPWHDWHCRIEGQAAHDVFINFKQHWRQSAKKKKHFDALIRMESISQELRSPSLDVQADGSTKVPEDDPTLRVFGEDDSENWHVQIFRSTDSGAVKGFPLDPGDAYDKNLTFSKGLVIDASTHEAYIQAIRSAQHFIYIENQYFIGSSFAWSTYKDAGADNLIPIELALKIASKIRANQRFAVYVVIPMWPEGKPNSNTVQQILCWQFQTMQMMYDIIAKELQDTGRLDAHPLDYLNFYCLGKRECIPKENLASEGSKVSNSQKFQRFMIYVHAKGMIVDDEYVILGSANINQRSMDGSRDTEIGMGAYQPHYSWASKKEHPRGQVYGFRTSLWAEHLDKVDSLFDNPENQVCIEEVNRVAEENWKKFIADDFTSLQGHLLKYPIQVDEAGIVRTLPGQEMFPDVGGDVLGKNSRLRRLLRKLTT